MPFGVQRRVPPHKLPHLTTKAVSVSTNVWYSSIFYVSGSAADTWWHPNHTSKEKEKKQGEEEKTVQANTLKENNDISISFRSGFGKKNPKRTSPWIFSLLKKCHLEFKEGSPPQIATFNYQGNQCINKCMIFIHILCIGFCSWYLMAPQPHI